MPPKKVNKVIQKKNENQKETENYYNKDKYKILKYKEDNTVNKLYKEWNTKIDNFTQKVNISKLMTEKVIPFHRYLNGKFESAWENKLYNLRLPKNFKNYKTISYDEILKGDFLKISDDVSNGQIQMSTEKKYLDDIRTLDTYKRYNKNLDTTNLDWLITNEHLLIPDLIKQSNEKGYALSTFTGKIKSIIRYLRLMLGANHELRIKYSVLYGNLDNIIKFEKGENLSGGNDIMDMGDLFKVVDKLQENFHSYYDSDWNLIDKTKINDAFKANMDFLSIAIMVWDYPSRSDKYDTTIITDRKDATNKTTYLVNDENHMLYWIYRKDVKAIGRDNVVVPLEKNGLQGMQNEMNKAIKLSLKLFPREYLFVPKTTNWKNKVDITKSSKWESVSSWAKTIQKKLKPEFKNLEQKNLAINLFRRSFVTYHINIMNNNEQRKMAHAMLTSFAKMNTYYTRKFDTVELKSKVKLEYEEPYDYNTTIDVESQNEQIHRAIRITDKVVPKPIEKKQPMTGAQRQQKYYKNMKNDKDFQEKRQDIESNPLRKIQRVVRELNQGKKNFKMMFKSTINEYKISYNPTTKLYSSSLLK